MKEAVFPTGTGVTPYNPGMTLRDYFAVKAMQGLLADPNNEWEDTEYAEAAYVLADAMMEARK
jgi:hypothetical protein